MKVFEAPARVQATQDELDKYFQSLGRGRDDLNAVLNVYYGKSSGGDSSRSTRKRSAFKCNVAKDSGTTKADALQDKGRSPYICLWFARGMCTKGESCSCLHRIPDAMIDDFDPNVDCFGRTKHSNYRDDYKGIGSFLHTNKSLFVGYVAKGTNPQKFKSATWRNFEPFGQIDSIKTYTSYAIVSYVYEWNAQFAKEAMSNQTLTGKETLMIQWDKEAVSASSKQQSAAEAEARAHVQATIQDIEPASLDDETVATEQAEEQLKVVENPPLKRIKTDLISAETIARIRDARKQKQKKQSLVDYD